MTKICTVSLHRIEKVSKVIQLAVIEQWPRSYGQEPPPVPIKTESYSASSVEQG